MTIKEDLTLIGESWRLAGISSEKVLMRALNAPSIQEIDAFVREFLSVVQRLPHCISSLHALSRRPLPSTYSELRIFCTANEATFLQLRRSDSREACLFVSCSSCCYFCCCLEGLKSTLSGFSELWILVSQTAFFTPRRHNSKKKSFTSFTSFHLQFNLALQVYSASLFACK